MYKNIAELRVVDSVWTVPVRNVSPKKHSFNIPALDTAMATLEVLNPISWYVFCSAWSDGHLTHTMEPSESAGPQHASPKDGRLDSPITSNEEPIWCPFMDNGRGQNRH